MSVGQVLVMPASIIADIFINKYFLPWPAYVGIGLVILGTSLLEYFLSCITFLILFPPGLNVFQDDMIVHLA